MSHTPLKQEQVTLDRGESHLFYARAVVCIAEKVTATGVDKIISAEDDAVHTQEDLRRDITQFQVDTIDASGHFEDASNVAVSIGAGNDAPKVLVGSVFYVEDNILVITSIVGDGTGNDGVVFTKISGTDLVALTYDCTAIYGTMFNATTGVLELGSYEDTSGSDICTGGTPSADSEYLVSYGADKAFDDNTSTRWYSSNTAFPHWLKYDLGAGNATVAKRYRMYANSSYAPKDWTFQGSNDDTNWTTLDTRTDVAYSTTWEEYNFSNSTAYRYYRIYVTDNNSTSNYCSIAEFEIYELPLINYTTGYVTVKTTQSGFYAWLWDDINSGTVVETLNSQNIYYSVCYDGMTFKVFDGSSWRAIASNDPDVHGNVGDTDWYYRDTASVWAKDIDDVNWIISKAVSMGANNQMSGTVFNAITDAEWNSSGGFDTTVTRFDMAATLYSDDDEQNPNVASTTLNIDETGFKTVSIGESCDYVIHRRDESGYQQVLVGKRTDGSEDIVVTFF